MEAPPFNFAGQSQTLETTEQEGAIPLEASRDEGGFVHAIGSLLVAAIPGVILGGFLFIYFLVGAAETYLKTDRAIETIHAWQQGAYFVSFETAFTDLARVWKEPALSVAVIAIALGMLLTLFMRALNPRFSELSQLNVRRVKLFLVMALTLVGTGAVALGVVVFLSPVLPYTPELALATTLFILWLFWHERGFLGSLRRFRRDAAVGTPYHSFFHGIATLYGLIWRVAMLSAYITANFWLVKGIVHVSFPMYASVGPPWSSLGKFVLIMLAVSLTSFAFVSLAYAIREIRLKPKFMLRILPPLFALLLNAALWQNVVRDFERFEYTYNPNLRFSSQNLAPTVVVLDQNGIGTYRVKESASPAWHRFQNPRDLTPTQTNPNVLPDLFKQSLLYDSVACNDQNLKQAEQFENHLKSLGFASNLTRFWASFSAAHEDGCYGKLWDLERMNEARFKALNGISHQPSSTALIRSIRMGTRSKSILKLIDQLTNDKKYRLSKQDMWQLGVTYAHYGLQDKAIPLLSRALEMGYTQAGGLTLDELTQFTFSQGAIRGKIALPDDLKANIRRIGLLISDPLSNGKSRDQVGRGRYGLLLLTPSTDKRLQKDYRLVASADLKPDGTFAFSDLVDDEYQLALLITQYPNRSVSLATTTNLALTVTPQNASIDIGAIVLQ